MSNSRALTAGEILLAKKIYKTSLNYSLVKIHNGKYNPMQPKNSGMTPNGEIYVDGAYTSNYAAARPVLKAFFIHEMAHVYQYQLNIFNPIGAALGEIFKHGFNYDQAYYYTLDPNKDLLDYGIEQQAQIIEDYFRVNFITTTPKGNYMQNKLADVVRDSLFTKVLKRFIDNPAYAKHDLVCKRKMIGKKRKLFCTRILLK